MRWDSKKCMITISRNLLLSAFGLMLCGMVTPPSNKAGTDRELVDAVRNAGQSLATLAATSARDDGCPSGAEVRASDLCAQWKAADAARDAANYAFFSLIAGIIGTSLLVWTLWETRTNARAQLRGYMTFKSGSISNVEIGKKVRITFDLTNSGTTPCKITASAVGIAFEKYPPQNIPKLDPELVEAPSWEGSGGEFSQNISTGREMNEAEFNQYDSGEYSFVASCEILYEDIFGRKFRTLISVQNNKLRNSNPSQISVMRIGNHAS